jgi:DNA-damage-inducible protein J
LPSATITRAEAKNAFYELREQAGDVEELTLDEINAEISAVREERKR